jgi:hypothetical protein
VSDVEFLIELPIRQISAQFQKLVGRPAVVLQQSIEQIHAMPSLRNGNRALAVSS